MSDPPAPKPNGVTGLLAVLARSTDRWVQLGTLGLIAFSGFGNWMATWTSSDRNKEEIRSANEQVRTEVRHQISDMHKWIEASRDEFHKGNEDSAANRKMLNALVREDLESFERRQLQALQNQNTIMASQTQILENDTRLIREIHDIVEKFNRWKELEQRRGAPP